MREVDGRVVRAPMKPTPPLCSLILAGGPSRRMGVDKACLRYAGEPQVRVLADLLTRVTQEVFVSVSRAQIGRPEFSGLNLLEDEVEGIGPLAGLLRAFHHDPGAAWLVVAVDLPGVTIGTLERLIRARDRSAFATAYRSPLTGLPEPVCAIYEPEIRKTLEEASSRGGGPGGKDSGDRGRHSLMLLKSLRVRLIDAASPQELVNVNEPADYEAARVRIASKPPRDFPST